LALVDTQTSFLLMRAIDRAFANLSPYVNTRHRGRISRHLKTFRRLNRYNECADFGAVIPRRTFPTRPQAVPDHEAEHLHSLMVVPTTTDGLHFSRVPPDLDFSESLRETEAIVLGCVPFLHDLDELELRRIQDENDWYSIRARTDRGWADHWQRRIAEVLTRLDRSGAHVGVLPELALTDELLLWWRRALRQTPPPPESRLEWILVGTGPITVDVRFEQQPNRAVLLHRNNGKVVFHQDKVEPFTLTDQHLEEWQLVKHLGNGPLAEWKRRAWDRYVVDARVGRFAILVCEDHDRLTTVGAHLSSLAPTHLLIPVFAPPILRHHWQEQAAIRFANQTGSASVVVTSYAIKRATTARRPGRRAVEAGVALTVMPKQRGPSDTWTAEARVDDAGGDPAGVVLFVIPRA
jgi:predicted amidohydrolase